MAQLHAPIATRRNLAKSEDSFRSKSEDDMVLSNSSSSGSPSPTPGGKDGKIREYDRKLIYVTLPCFPSGKQGEENYQYYLNLLTGALNDSLAEISTIAKNNRIKKLNLSHCLNLGLDKESNVCNWAYIYVQDIRVANALLGKNFDGSDRISYSSSFYKKSPKQFSALEKEYCNIYYGKEWSDKKFLGFLQKNPMTWIELDELDREIGGANVRVVDGNLAPLVKFPYPLESAYYYKAFETCRTNVVRIRYSKGSKILKPNEISSIFEAIHPITEKYPEIHTIKGVQWVIFDPQVTGAGELARTIFGRNKYAGGYFTLNHPSDKEYNDEFGKNADYR
jgi:hypothetical protein